MWYILFCDHYHWPRPFVRLATENDWRPYMLRCNVGWRVGNKRLSSHDATDVRNWETEVCQVLWTLTTKTPDHLDTSLASAVQCAGVTKDLGQSWHYHRLHLAWYSSLCSLSVVNVPVRINTWFSECMNECLHRLCIEWTPSTSELKATVVMHW